MGARAVVYVAGGGIVAGQLVAVPAWWAGAAALGAGLAWFATRHAALPWLALGLAAVGIGAQRAAAVDRPRLAAGHVARLDLPLRVTLDATVERIRRGAGGRAVLLLRATAVTRAGGSGAAEGRVRLGVRAGLAKLRAGDDIRIETTLRAPRNFRNPGGFDFAGYLARRRVFVTASVWDGERVVRRPRPTRGAAIRLERWRERLARGIRRAVPAPRAAVLEALVLGAGGRVSPALREAFARAGVAHVLAVSGLHVGLVAGAGFALASWLLGRSERLLLLLDVRRLAALASLGPAALYGALAGFEVATVRSVTMLAAGVGVLLLDRRAPVPWLLALAAAAIALAQPGAPRDIGFQLSFVSILALVLGVGRWGPRNGGWRARGVTVVVVAAAAVLGTAPLTALHFRQVSLMAVLANPLAVPLFGSVVVVLGLAGALLETVWVGGAERLFGLAGHALRPGIALVEWLAGAPWAALEVPRPTPLELGLLYALLAGCVMGGRAGRRLALAAAVALAFDIGCWVRARHAPGTLRVTFLDVGQGDAAVAELPDGRVLVVDAGGFPGSDFDTGAAVVAPYLASRKIARPDVLAMTHAHPDHFFGLVSLIRRYRPRELWWTGHAGRGAQWRRLVEAVADTGVPTRVLRAGDVPPGWQGTLEVLHPPHGWPSPDLNDGSLTLRLRHGAVAILLTGDIEAGGEAALLAGERPLAAAVLKVPHHGSRTSSTPALLHRVAPRLAVMSVGADNRYRLPSPEVEARYAARGICVLRTDRCGAVTTVSDGRSLRVSTAGACGCPAGTFTPQR